MTDELEDAPPDEVREGEFTFDVPLGSRRGDRIWVTFTRWSERFTTTVAGETLSAVTLDELREKVRERRRKTRVKVQVPVSILGWVWHEPQYGRGHWRSGQGARHGYLTGMHGGTGNVVFVDNQGETEQLGRRRYVLTRRLSDTEVAEYFRLVLAKGQAERALSQFLDPRELDPHEAVQAAIAEKVDTPEEAAAEADELAEDPR